MGFVEKIQAAAAQNRSWLCIGLDADLEKIPSHLVDQFGDGAILDFNKAIIEQTKDLVCAYKPNSAFYEALGPSGLEMLLATRQEIPANIPMILDVKRGDIGNTAKKYAHASFEIYGADAVTLSPYMGWDSVEPFYEYDEKGLFLLCRTSNPGAQDIQDLMVEDGPLYQEIAIQIERWGADSPTRRIGAVVGATYPDELGIVRKIMGEDALILIPGVGSQAGDLEAAFSRGANSNGEGAIINAARSVIYASGGPDFAEAARMEAIQLRESLERALPSN
jgi:orotidine-5'-phosphate decarboxylase